MRRALSTFAITAVLLLAGFLTSCRNQQTVGIRNAVFIVVDTLRRDHLGAYGYARDTSPSIDALAAEGVRFDRAYATSGWTIPSVTSMLTGLYPSGHGVVRPRTALSAEIPTLAGILRERGFATAGVVSHVVIGKRWGLSRGFDWFDERNAKGEKGTSTEGVTDSAISMLERLSAGDAPFFLFVHYFDPHYTYQRHEEFDFAAAEAGRLRGGEEIASLRALGTDMTQEERVFVRDLYDGEIRHTDAGIGRLLDRLKSLDHYDDTLILFTADHGEEFLERGWLGHTRTLYDELVRVPLILRLPQPATRAEIDELVSLTMLAPTIMELLGLEIPESFSQPSLVPQLSAAPDATPALSAADPLRVITEVDFVPVSQFNVDKITKQVSLVGPRFKLIHDLLSGEIELYDLGRDPGERDDLAEREPERVRELTEQLDALLREVVPNRNEGLELNLSAEEIEELRALGYGE
ncbi:MAG: sulfatase [Myxococcota bacterium]